MSQKDLEIKYVVLKANNGFNLNALADKLNYMITENPAIVQIKQWKDIAPIFFEVECQKVRDLKHD